ncbi:small RNA 2'-O-methyltransferase-like isoform X2 [Ostrea edulis]|uniref:small RNA 2'-O-methyltransferase-like isoform X2 n=1 Tax=Ostrea edulis TaxID=37623 RepID=UPI0024AF9A39|nr:small RNA 2'-O-methyltransferase-like isoform X2 [Ostrea edulis]
MSVNLVEQDIFTEKEPDTLNPDERKGKLEDENSLGRDVRFYPPLYMQRYSYTANILEKHNVEWVVDFGCSECGIVRFYREVPTLRKVQLVDIDRETLEFHKNCIKPHASDYIFKRKNPLSIEIYEGSAVNLDQRVTGCDAVSMVEFIEHLVPDILVKVEDAVFGRLHPFLVIVTTPNFEFNTLFPGKLRFRHFDHKFEWTRKEFQKWCQDVCDKYRYSVEFSGIGDPPEESQQLGYCSQAAIFTSSSQSKPTVDSDGNCYCLVAQSIFPHRDKELLLSPEEILKLEVTFTINLLKQSYPDKYSDQEQDEEQMEISIKQLMLFSKISKLVNADRLSHHIIHMDYPWDEDVTYRIWGKGQVHWTLK